MDWRRRPSPIRSGLRRSLVVPPHKRRLVEPAEDEGHRRRQPLLGFWLRLMTADDELAAHRDGLQLDVHAVAVFVREGDADASPGGFFRALTVFVIIDDQHIVSVMNVSGIEFFSHVAVSYVK